MTEISTKPDTALLLVCSRKVGKWADEKIDNRPCCWIHEQLVHATALPMTLPLDAKTPGHNHMPPIADQFLALSIIALSCKSQGYP